MSDLIPIVETPWRVWVRVTTEADRRWREALDDYHGALFANTRVSYPDSVERRRFDSLALDALSARRAEYRRTVLDAYWRCLVPMKPGSVVPDEVSTLLAEQWDIDTRGPLTRLSG